MPNTSPAKEQNNTQAAQIYPLTNHLYDPSVADDYVRPGKLLVSKRFWQFCLSLINFLLSSIYLELTFFFQKKSSVKKKKIKHAQIFVALLIKLGPTFIKLGQFLSTRSDIFPYELIHELSALQDKVPPFSFDLVQQTIESELGNDISLAFLEFDEMPIASASIGQVHRAKLHNGKLVVVKVQRPNLMNELYHDLGLMRLIIKLSRNFNKATENHYQSWIELSDQFGQTLFKEINYLHEGQNADRLRQLLRQYPEIRIPRIIWRQTTRKVLTLEYIGGIKIDQIHQLEQQGFDLNKLAEKLVNCYLDQIIVTGFFHADPHPGNLAIDEYGNIIIYDFGMMGELEEETRKNLFNMILAVAKNDSASLAQCLIKLRIVNTDANMNALTRTVNPLIDYYQGEDLLDLNFNQIERDLDRLLLDNSFRLPSHLAYLIRALSCLEGIARTLKSNFSFVECVKPRLKKWAFNESVNQFVKTGQWSDLAHLANFSANSGEEKPSLGSHLLMNDTSNDESQEKQFISGQNQIRAIKNIITSYILLSSFIILILTCTQGLQLGLYFLLGNYILGLVIYMRLVNLEGWSKQFSKGSKKDNIR